MALASTTSPPARRATVAAIAVVAVSAIAFVANGTWLLAVALDEGAGASSDPAFFDVAVALNGLGGTAVVLATLAGVLTTRARPAPRGAVLVAALVATIAFIVTSRLVLRGALGG